MTMHSGKASQGHGFMQAIGEPLDAFPHYSSRFAELAVQLRLLSEMAVEVSQQRKFCRSDHGRAVSSMVAY